jgi:signal peptidase I
MSAPEPDTSGAGGGAFRRAWRFFWYDDGTVAWIRSALIALVLTLFIRWPLIEPFSIPSGSMEPTFHGDPRFLRGDRVFVNKWIYGVRVPFMNQRLWRGAEPERWDIVVFRSAEDDPTHKILVKRLVALPGERVQIANGQLYIDGQPMPVPEEVGDFEYTRYGRYGVAPSAEYSVVPEDHYLVLGDNSSQSRDGRVFGWLPNDHILGRVACIWWPVPRMRDLTGFTASWWWRGSLTLLAVFIVWRMFIGRSWRVHGRELGSRFAPRAHLYINRLAFGFPVPMTRQRLGKGRPPRRGEIVAYYANVNGHVVVLAGRVAGLPGETVSAQSKEGLAVDGAPLSLPTNPGEDGASEAESAHAAVVPADSYYLVTEDTESLPDSRTFGPIASKDLAGPATFVWWPPGKWGKLAP